MLTLDSWVFSSKFGSLFPSTYNNSISNTSRLQEGYPWSNCYGDGSCVAGDVYTETVNVGGIVVNNQTIGVAKEVNYPGTTHLKGVLGLSFNKNSMSKNFASFCPSRSCQTKLKTGF